MFVGHFPESYESSYERRAFRSGEDATPLGATTRRQWLVMLGVTGLGTASGFFVGRAGGAVADVPTPPVGPGVEGTPDRGSLEWALWMAEQPDDVLLPAAGDLERVCMRFRQEQRLVPGFVRVIEIVLRSELPEADVAGACAVRSLARLARFDLVQQWRERILGRADLVETRETLERIESRLSRQRRGR